MQEQLQRLGLLDERSVARAFQALHELVCPPQTLPGVQPHAHGEDQTHRAEDPDVSHGAGAAQTAEAAQAQDPDPHAFDGSAPVHAWAGEGLDLELGAEWYDDSEAAYLLGVLDPRQA